MKERDKLLKECKMMLELAINSLEKAGYDTEYFKTTVDKIKALNLVCNYCKGEGWIDEDMITTPCNACGGKRIER